MFSASLAGRLVNPVIKYQLAPPVLFSGSRDWSGKKVLAVLTSV